MLRTLTMISKPFKQADKAKNTAKTMVATAREVVAAAEVAVQFARSAVQETAKGVKAVRKVLEGLHAVSRPLWDSGCQALPQERD